MSRAESAPVVRILPLSSLDGVGARSVVFLQGCNLSCLYCHNPETQQLCSGCGACVALCPRGALRRTPDAVLWDSSLCLGCDLCQAACERYSSPRVTWMTAEDVMAEILPALPFIRGITVSGGECTLQVPFLQRLFLLAREAGKSCFIDSNGTADFSALPQLMALTDGVLLDVKAWGRAEYDRLTGGRDNSVVKKNIAFLLASGKLADLRIVHMRHSAETADIIRGLAEVLGDSSAKPPIRIIAFRPQGVRAEGKENWIPEQEELAALRLLALQYGLNVVII